METVRYTTPGKLDMAPYGTVAKVIEEDGSATRWVQLNPTTDNHANWVSMGKLLEDTFDKYFDWEEFTVLLILTNQNKSVETINRFGRYLSQLLI